MHRSLPVYIGSEATNRLIEYCKQNQLQKFHLVADERTYAALGQAVEEAVASSGFDVKTTVLTGAEVIADAHYVMQVLLGVDGEERTFLAVGSGTITDITRFVSHRLKSAFISLPTAPSVDGFTSIGAPMIVGGLKETIIAQPPIAIFADLPTLEHAPGQLIASGFGDMVGKFTSVADWRLGHLIWGEPFDETIAQRSYAAAEQCTRHAAEIGKATETGIRVLIEGLIESGMCMLDFGSSRPASGAEHHCSHYWEMRLLQEGRPAILHGAKVGVASILIAKAYYELRQMPVSQVSQLMEAARLPIRDHEVARIESAYGATAAEVIAAQRAFLDMTPAEFRDLKHRIVQEWSRIQDIARTVPLPEELASVLELAGAPTKPEELGLGSDEVGMALEYSHYLRDRFTVSKLKYVSTSRKDS